MTPIQTSPWFSSISLRLPLFLLLGLVLAGCDNSLQIIDEDDNEAFSVFGYLNMSEEFNFVRVYDLDDPVVADSTETLDATVTLEDLSSGEREVLQDSVVVFDGVYTHNFRTTMSFSHNTSYLLRAEKSSGEATEIIATIPEKAEISVVEPMPNCTTYVSVEFEPFPFGSTLFTSIGYELGDTTNWVNRRYITLADEKKIWLEFSPQQILPLNCENLRKLDSDSLKVRYTIYSPDFFDGPGSAIPGDLGRFGGMYEGLFTFPIDTVKICRPFRLC